MNNLIDFIANFFRPYHFTGVLADTRSQAEQELDAVHDEVVAAGAPPAWTYKAPADWKTILPHRDQDGSSGCLSFAAATSLQNNLKQTLPLSAHDIYQRRSNYPEEGMIPYNAIQIATTGVALESTLPSDNLSEAEMNMKSEAQAILNDRAQNAGGIPVKLTLPLDLDQVAAIIDRGLSLVLCVRFIYAEWNQVPRLITNYPNLGHGIAATDRTLYEGEKSIIIQDQWKIDSTMYPGGLRVLKESWLAARCFFAGYVLPNPIPPTPQPVQSHIFTIDMRYGDQNNEVFLLQTRLVSLGLLHVTPTGFFGGLTKQAVILYQAAHNLPQTGFCGPLTRQALNS